MPIISIGIFTHLPYFSIIQCMNTHMINQILLPLLLMESTPPKASPKGYCDHRISSLHAPSRHSVSRHRHPSTTPPYGHIAIQAPKLPKASSQSIKIYHLNHTIYDKHTIPPPHLLSLQSVGI